MVTNNASNNFPKMNSNFQLYFLTLISESESTWVIQYLKCKIDSTFDFVKFTILSFSLLKFIRSNPSTSHVSFPNSFYFLKTIETAKKIKYSIQIIK